MRPTRRTFLATGAIVALLLAGCGSGGEGSGGPTATIPSQSAPKSLSQSHLPPPMPGSKVAGPGVPTSREGDNSIQTWGLEASDAKREEATAAVQAYLDARAARDWSDVCSHLAGKPRAEQGRYAGGAGCAKAMASFAADASSAVLRQEAEVDVLSFRVGGGYAFLIYRRRDGVYATALSRESGSWKIVSVTPTPVE